MHIGLIGLGRMGNNMRARLRAKGMDVGVAGNQFGGYAVRKS